MPAEQKEIYYLIGESREQIENSPYLEAFKANGQEVLLLTDPVDEYLVGSLDSVQGQAAEGRRPRRARRHKDADEKAKAATEEKFKPLLDALKAKLSDDVADVRLSARLKESAAVLVAEEGAMGAHMERLLKRMGRGEDIPAVQTHAGTQPRARRRCNRCSNSGETNPADPRVEDFGRLLYDQAVIAEGSRSEGSRCICQAN